MKTTFAKTRLFLFVASAVNLFACSSPFIVDADEWGGQAGSVPADVKPAARLSNRGLYRDIRSRTVVDTAMPYTPDYPLWSDGADKKRWLMLPPGARIETSDMAHWRFP